MTPKNIAIIGAGNLGSRHLQALALTEIPLAIQVVDPSKDSLDIAKKRWEEMKENPLVKSLSFHENISDLNPDLDVVIVATSSKPRCTIVKQLLAKCRVSYMILEKVLFPQLSDYDEVQRLIADKNIKVWVNCGRRNTSFYKKMHDLFKSEKNITMNVSGDNWGLGCNTIHYLDTYAFITDQKIFTFDTENLDKNCISSKRGGDIEFTGSLRFKSPKGELMLTSYNQELAPSIITIQSENLFALINETEKFANVLTRHGWQWKKFDMDIKYQSQLTQNLVKELILTGECGLPTYEESSALHKVMLSGFLYHYNRFCEEGAFLCPIT